MTFKPTPKLPPRANSPKDWQRLVVNFRAHQRELRDRIETAAAAHGLTISVFCREAIEYAMDNMED
jgi:hypothetical protein